MALEPQEPYVFYGGLVTVSLVHNTETDEIESVEFNNDLGGRATITIGTVDGNRRTIDLPAKARARNEIARGRRPKKSQLSQINIDLPEFER